jgi:hypothetical protein
MRAMFTVRRQYPESARDFAYFQNLDAEFLAGNLKGGILARTRVGFARAAPVLAEMF